MEKNNMSCRFSSGLIVKRLFDGIKDLVKIVNLQVDQDGWTIQAFDESHIASVMMKLNLTAFEKYTCTKPLKIGIHVGNMSKVLRLCESVDALIFHYGEDDDHLLIRIEKEASARVVEFELKLMEYENDEFPPAEELSDEFVELPASEYSRITKDLQNFGNDLEIHATPTLVSFKASGELGAGNINLKSMDESTGAPGVTINLSKSFTQKFPLRFAATFGRAASCNTYASLHFSEDKKAMVVRFALDDRLPGQEKKERKEKEEANKAEIKTENAKTRLATSSAGHLYFNLCPKD
eukprot:GEMP01016801.1.p1 GENE.GEMP01016801.1~~GEMP01016801.1.p1  ORF type:complete len:302 (-),score=86.15 GEMP01016801.1:1940-2821(-)